MSTLTANGDAVISAKISFPRMGAWTAAIEVNATSLASGKITIASNAFALTLVGTAFRAGEFAGSYGYRVVGGAGGLTKRLAAKAYRSVPVRIPLRDALTEGGETLSSTSDSATIGRTLERWSRLEGPLGLELGRLSEALSATWCVADDGTAKFGPRSYPSFALDYLVNSNPPSENRITISGPDIWKLRPGVTLDGLKIERVEVDLTESHSRATAWYL